MGARQNGDITMNDELSKNGQEITEDAALVRREFAGTSIEKKRETAATAMASQARAAVEARYVVALQRPRDIMQARTKMLQACKRHGFAELSRYSVPRGGQNIQGWTIRMAAARDGV